MIVAQSPFLGSCLIVPWCVVLPFLGSLPMAGIVESLCAGVTDLSALDPPLALALAVRKTASLPLPMLLRGARSGGGISYVQWGSFGGGAAPRRLGKS